MHKQTVKKLLWPLAILYAFIVSSPLYSQEIRNNLSPVSFKIDSQLVLIPLTVTDKRGAIVNGLPASAFRIFEDKIDQKIYSFSEQDVPASIGVVLDVSGSMKSSLEHAKMALQSLLNGANPQDEGFLYCVSSQPVGISGFTGDLNDLSSQVLFTQAQGSTALVDTIYLSLRQFHSARHPRRGLVVISDGMDNHSRHTASQLLSEALEADVQIYTISVSQSTNLKPMQLQRERQGLEFLEELAGATGGVSFLARNASDIDKAAERIGRVLRTQYVIGYIPNCRAGKNRWHAVEVTLNRPGVTIHARPGYYAYSDY